MNLKFKNLAKIAALGAFAVAMVLNVQSNFGKELSLNSAVGSETAPAASKDESEDTKTFEEGDKLSWTTTSSNSGSSSSEAGVNVQIPVGANVTAGANGSQTFSFSSAGTTVSGTIMTVPKGGGKYHRWVCDDSMGSCVGETSGSDWRKASDPLPPRAGWIDSWGSDTGSGGDTTPTTDTDGF